MILSSSALRSGEPGGGGGTVRCFLRRVGAGSSDDGASCAISSTADGNAGFVSAGGGVLGASTDQPSASPAIRPSVSSLRERLVADGVAVRVRWFASSIDQPSVKLAVRPASVVTTFAFAADVSFASARAGGVPPGAGVARSDPDADGPRVAGVGVARNAADADVAPGGERVRPLASPAVVRAGSIDAGGDGRDVGPDRAGAGVAAGVAAAGGSSLGDSTDQPDARSAIRLLVSSPSRRRVRSSSGTARP